MSSSDQVREFFETVAVAARAARETLVQRTIEQHAPRAQERVARLREEHPEMSNEGVADLLIRDAASQAAAAGALIALPGLVPGPGTALSVAMAGPEIPWLFREQIKLVLEIGTLYGRDPSDAGARVPEVESLFKSAFAATHFGNTGTQLVLAMAARGGRRRSLQLLQAALRLAARMGGVALRTRRVFRGLPLLGIPIGAGVNAMLLIAAGNEARQRYSQVTLVQTDAADAEANRASTAPGEPHGNGASARTAGEHHEAPIEPEETDAGPEEAL